MDLSGLGSLANLGSGIASGLSGGPSAASSSSSNSTSSPFYAPSVFEVGSGSAGSEGSIGATSQSPSSSASATTTAQTPSSGLPANPNTTLAGQTTTAAGLPTSVWLGIAGIAVASIITIAIFAFTKK